MYITLEELLLFCSLIIAVIKFVYTIITNKKKITACIFQT